MSQDTTDSIVQNIGFFVPEWFVRATLAGEDKDVIRNKLTDELAAAHKIAGRQISPFELREKTDDLYETYMETLEEYQTGSNAHGVA